MTEVPIHNQSSASASVVKAAATVGAITFCSRLAGCARDIIFAWLFGTGLFADAFIAAFRVPNLFRRLFGEGALTASFVPVFTQVLDRRGRAAAFDLACAVLYGLMTLLLAVTLLGIFFAPQITRCVAAGFAAFPSKFQLTVTLTRIMFPYIIWVCLLALSMGILNSLGRFAPPAMAPIILNLTLIGVMTGAFIFGCDGQTMVVLLALGVLVGGFLQLMVQVPFLHMEGFWPHRPAAVDRTALRKISWGLLPAVIGSAVYQINTIINTLLASYQPEGSVSYLYFADRLVQFPMGLIGVALAVAALPRFSTLAAQADKQGLRGTFTKTLNLLFFLTIPAAVGIIILREPIIRLLFERGAFSADASRLTADALLYYALGIWAFAGARIAVAVLHALQDFKTPLKVALVCIGTNTLLGFILMEPMGYRGLAVAVSIASVANFMLLLRKISETIGFVIDRSDGWRIANHLACSAVMAIGVLACKEIFVPGRGASTLALASGVGACVLLGAGLYATAALVLKSEELRYIIEAIKRG
jgi:putative peptidoglycan lipid II flippase